MLQMAIIFCPTSAKDVHPALPVVSTVVSNGSIASANVAGRRICQLFSHKHTGLLRLPFAMIEIVCRGSKAVICLPSVLPLLPLQT